MTIPVNLSEIDISSILDFICEGNQTVKSFKRGTIYGFVFLYKKKLYLQPLKMNLHDPSQQPTLKEGQHDWYP